jgi:myosin protein heavy chain
VKSQSGDPTDQESVAEVVLSSSGETRTVPLYALSPMNPPQFDGVEDIADLTHLNEASVINNLKMRYGAGDIYVSSFETNVDKLTDRHTLGELVSVGTEEAKLIYRLFLISLNPYRNLPIYTPRIVAQYRTKRREENPPHIYAVAERAWQQIGEERESQSILIT